MRRYCMYTGYCTDRILAGLLILRRYCSLLVFLHCSEDSGDFRLHFRAAQRTFPSLVAEPCARCVCEGRSTQLRRACFDSRCMRAAAFAHLVGARAFLPRTKGAITSRACQQHLSFAGIGHPSSSSTACRRGHHTQRETAPTRSAASAAGAGSLNVGRGASLAHPHRQQHQRQRPRRLTVSAGVTGRSVAAAVMEHAGDGATVGPTTTAARDRPARLSGKERYVVHTLAGGGFTRARVDPRVDPIGVRG